MLNGNASAIAIESAAQVSAVDAACAGGWENADLIDAIVQRAIQRPRCIADLVQTPKIEGFLLWFRAHDAPCATEHHEVWWSVGVTRKLRTFTIGV